jgi:DNA-binding NarL/FixJ family response regulator
VEAVVVGVLCRAMLVCEHPIFREGLQALFNETADVVVSSVVGSVAEAGRTIGDVRPDIVVIDAQLRYDDGPAAVARLAREFSDIRIVILSDVDDGGFIRRTIDAGAKAFVLKRSPREAVLYAVRSVAAGGMYIDPAAAARVFPCQPRSKPNEVPATSELLPLTFREQEVVRLIALGYTAKEIAADLNVTMKTVETYKARACEKLGMRTRVQLVRLAAAQGWLSGIARMSAPGLNA